MQKFNQKSNAASRYILFIVGLGLAFPISGLITKYIEILSNGNFVFPYAMPLIMLFITWGLYRLDGWGLSALGLNPSVRHLLYFPAGFIFSLLFYSITIILISLITGAPLSISPDPKVNTLYLLMGAYQLFASVLLEELVFRGYCFMKTKAITNVRTAQIIFALLFVVYHWFNKNLLGQPVVMMIFLVYITLGHLLFSTALLRSGSMYLSLGIHLGWNWTDIFIFGKTAGEKTMYITTYDSGSWFYFIVKQSVSIVVILFMIWLLQRLVKRRSTGPLQLSEQR
ncbi:CPBP family intramembrane metalloprotease [Chitinophaga sp. Mgbs1]|uniref:CPBP family intramembrane metalloprotease n=1 Tax=Chitinophaga solisilvae TaxID=1233460 RepID=A0A433WF08_9BACT|nr:CPBP family intramembrane metalloprotease [Chitinophaga solisilvae]